MPVPTAAEPLPPQTEDSVMIAALVKCFVRTLSRKERIAFLRDVSVELKLQVDNAEVIRLRATAFDRETLAARRRASTRWSIMAEKIAEALR